MATRIYTAVSGSVGVTPSTWNFGSQVNPVTVPGTLVKNSGAVMTSKTEATGTVSPVAKAMGRTIIGPLAAQTISGTVKGQMRGQESNAGANANHALAIKIVKPDGTDRGVLLSQTAADLNSSPHEYVTSLTNSKFENSSESASITLTSQTATAGDYLVIEWGFRSATTVTRNITLSYGNDNATDLPEDTTTTAANNPWWEFSGNIGFIQSAAGSGDGVGSFSATGVSIFNGVLSIASAASDGIAGAAIFTGTLSSAGSASTSLVGETVTGTSNADLSSAGTGAFSPSGIIIASAVLSSTGAASDSLSGIAVTAASMTSPGAGATSITGQSIATASLSSSGQAATNISGTGTAAAALNSFGSGAFTGSAILFTTASISSAGQASGSLAAQGINQTSFTMAGQSGDSLALTVLSCASITATGAGDSGLAAIAIANGALSSDGTSTVTFSSSGAGTVLSADLQCAGAADASVAFALIQPSTLSVDALSDLSAEFIMVAASDFSAESSADVEWISPVEFFPVPHSNRMDPDQLFRDPDYSRKTVPAQESTFNPSTRSVLIP